MAEDLYLAALERLGWEVHEHRDICWLDDHEPGFRKVDQGREIFLCLADALVLERGKVFGTYSGAPLPPDSKAVAWPWRYLEQAVAS